MLAKALEWEDYEGISIAGVTENTEIECVLDTFYEEGVADWEVAIIVGGQRLLIGNRVGLAAAKRFAQYAADVLRLMQEKPK